MGRFNGIPIEKKAGPRFGGVPVDRGEALNQEMAFASSGPEPLLPESIAQGITDPVHGFAQTLTHALPESVVEAGNELNNRLADMGIPLARYPEGGIDQQIAEREKEYQDLRKSEGATGVDYGRMGGNIISPVNIGLAAKLAPGMSIAKNAMAGGALGAGAPITGEDGEAVSPEDFSKEKLAQVLMGGATGAVIPSVLKTGARVVSPKTSPAISQLIDEGVSVTPGQVAGGMWKKAEEAARSVPIVGDAITAAHQRGIDSFNKAAINRALAPIGKQADEIGYKGIESAHRSISDAYEALLPKMTVQADAPFVADINNVRGMTKNLHPDRAKQFEAILDNTVLRKFEGTGLMHPKTMKEVDSQLGAMVRKYRGSPDADQASLGDALSEVQTSLRQMISRGNPQYAPELAKINEGFANLVRVERAAAMGGAKGGVFTPNQLESAVRATDTSGRKVQSAQGKALMQDLATAGDEGIAQKLPNSGTVDRLMLGGAGLGAGLVNPAIPVGLAAGAGAYSSPMQKLTQALLTSRPKAAEPVSEGMRKLIPYLTPSAVAAGQGGFQ